MDTYPVTRSNNSGAQVTQVTVWLGGPQSVGVTAQRGDRITRPAVCRGRSCRRRHGQAHRRKQKKSASYKQLREGLTVEEAINVLWVLTSFESLDLLVTGRSLTVDEAIDTLVDMAERAVCRTSGVPAARGPGA